MELLPMVMKSAMSIEAGDVLLLEGNYTLLVLRTHIWSPSCDHGTCIYMGIDSDGDLAYFETRRDVNYAVVML